jgi:hypothetical protein
MADSRRPMSPVIEIFSARLFSGDLPPTLARKEAECAGWGQEGCRIGASEVDRAMLGM